MGTDCRNISDGAIDATILLKEEEFIKFMVEASKKDRFGLWELALCKLKKAEEAITDIYVLQSDCDVSIHEFVNENTPPVV